MSSQIKNEHEAAIQEFMSKLAECTINTPEPPIACGRSYVRISKLVDWLQSEDTVLFRNYKTTRATILLGYAYHNWKGHLPMSREKLFDGEYRCIIVFSILLKLGWGHLIHLFRNHQLVDSKLPIYDLVHLKQTLVMMKEQSELPDDVPANPDEIAEAFDMAQYRFKPAVFQLEEFPTYNRKWIIPIHTKEKINEKGGTATLWQIEVLAEFVDDKLKDVVESSLYNNEEDTLGPRYHFALKVFNEGNASECKTEKEAFNALHKHDGMVQYLGGYNHQEIHHTTIEAGANPASHNNALLKATHNILLEYGDRDLDEHFAAILPPVLQHEIELFWKGLFEVADAVKEVHHFKVDNDGIIKEFVGWHGDIKPDNILEIQGKFKLADPGFAKIVELDKSKAKSAADPTANLSGGTDTFGSPERYAGRRASIGLDQTIDTWSLGCCFSIAATWVCLGYQGVRQYTALRERAIKSRITTQKSQPLDPIGPKLYPDDFFHDGVNVLPEVTSWHHYLRSTLRKSDRITGLVLDLVDRHMLVGSKSRIKSKELCQMLTKITENLGDSSTTVPKNIVEFLCEWDEELPEKAPEPLPVLDEESVDTISPMGAFQDRKARKFRLKGVPLLRTTHRSSIRPSLAAVPDAEEVGSQDSPSQSLTTPQKAINTTKDEYFPELQVPTPQSANTAVQPEVQLAWYNSSSPPMPSLRPTSTGLSGAMARPLLAEPEDVFQARENMERRDIARKKGRLLPGRRPKDDLLHSHYQYRDIKFLIDNAGSMLAHWGQLKYVLETLLMKVNRIDENGVDLSFTLGGVNIENAKTVDKVMATLKDPTAQPKAGAYTDMVRSLRGLFDDYLRYAKGQTRIGHRLKKLTLLVLTDGIWENTVNKIYVDQTIISFAQNLEKIMGRDIADRPVSIEFIQFGNDEDATLRLKRLDDDLVIDSIPDIVDTEHCLGDVNKMLLGSFNPLWDADLNAIPPASPTQPSGYADQRISQAFPNHTPPPTNPYPRASPPGPDPFTSPGPPTRTQTVQTSRTGGYDSLNNGQPSGTQWHPPANAPRDGQYPHRSQWH